MFILIAIVIELRDSITIVNTFAERLRLARAARRLTQAELASACGLSQSAIANYENGSRRSPKNVFPLAAALQVQALWLAEGKGEMQAALAYGSENLSGATPRQDTSALVLSEHRQGWTPWPFQQVTPDTYWSLDAASRTLIENTVASLIDSLKK